MPPTLKAWWVDYIHRPAVTDPFYDPSTPQPMGGRPAVLASTRGGAQDPGSSTEFDDQAIPALSLILGNALGMVLETIVATRPSALASDPPPTTSRGNGRSWRPPTRRLPRRLDDSAHGFRFPDHPRRILVGRDALACCGRDDDDSIARTQGRGYRVRHQNCPGRQLLVKPGAAPRGECRLTTRGEGRSADCSVSATSPLLAAIVPCRCRGKERILAPWLTTLVSTSITKANSSIS